MPGGLPILDERVDRRLGIGTGVTADFHHQNRTGVADHERAVAPLGEVRLGALEDMAVDQLTGARPVWQGEQIGLQGFLNRFKMPANERCVHGRQRITAELDLRGKEQGAFGAGDELAEVEGCFGLGIEHRGIHQ